MLRSDSVWSSCALVEEDGGGRSRCEEEGTYECKGEARGDAGAQTDPWRLPAAADENRGPQRRPGPVKPASVTVGGVEEDGWGWTLAAGELENAAASAARAGGVAAGWAALSGHVQRPAQRPLVHRLLAQTSQTWSLGEILRSCRLTVAHLPGGYRRAKGWSTCCSWAHQASCSAARCRAAAAPRARRPARPTD